MVAGRYLNSILVLALIDWECARDTMESHIRVKT